ncbi:MAG TPA: sigma-70 family RNA polymerase sigma factor [Pirellula sp.]|nr:sigma-70 family RNA polymerase sigma factor [Pirellula sp.]
MTKHAQNVLNAALRVVGNSDDADDVAQEVFLETFKNNRMYEYAEQPALIRTIATRRALDRLRRRKKAIQLDGRELDLRVSDPCESIVAAELDQQLRDALVNVPPREAEIFCLSAFEGYSTTAIAQMLSISKGAVAKSLCLARSRLSAALTLKQTEVKK